MAPTYYLHPRVWVTFAKSREEGRHAVVPSPGIDTESDKLGWAINAQRAKQDGSIRPAAPTRATSRTIHNSARLKRNVGIMAPR